jgi:hypothetical protein
LNSATMDNYIINDTITDGVKCSCPSTKNFLNCTKENSSFLRQVTIMMTWGVLDIIHVINFWNSVSFVAAVNLL